MRDPKILVATIHKLYLKIYHPVGYGVTTDHAVMQSDHGQSDGKPHRFNFYKLRPTLLAVEFNEESKNVGRNYTQIVFEKLPPCWPWCDDRSCRIAVRPWPK